MPIKATFTGDVTDLRRSTQQAREEFRKVGTEAEGAARQLKAVGSAFDGTKIEGAARRVASGIERIGGVARLTDSEIARNSRTISEVLQKYERMGVEAPANIRRLANELQQATGAARNLATASSGIGASLSKGFGALASGLGIGLGAGAGIAAITSIGSAIREAASEGARLTPLSQAFERFQGGAQQAERAILSLREATHGLVADADLMRAANQATVLGLSSLGLEFADVARVATVVGNALGKDATESIEQFSLALAKGSSERLDELGITLKASEAYEIYAARLKTSAEALTDEQKRRAFATIAMEKAQVQLAALGDVQLTVAQNAERISLAFGDIAAQAISAGNQSATLAGTLGEVANALAQIRGAGVGTSARVVLSEAAGAVQRTIRPFLAPTNIGGALLSSAASAIQQAAGVTQADILSVLTGRPQRTGQIGAAAAPAAPGGGRPGPTKEQIADAKKYREELQELTGEKLVADGARLTRQLRDIAAAGKTIASDNVEALAQRLMKARGAADTMSDAYREMGEALEGLQITSRRVEGLNPLFIQGSIDANARNAIATAARTTGSLAGMTGLISSTNPLAGQLVGLAPSLQSGIVRTKEETRKLGVEVRNVATAFAQLAQIAGPSLNGVTRGIGTTIASVDAASQLVASLSSLFPSLQTRDAQGNVVLSGRGQALAGGLAGLTTGLQVGGMFTSPGAAGVVGGASGFVSGALASGTAAGGFVGLGLGAAAAIYSAQQNRRAQRAAMDQQRQSIIASMGGVEAFQEAVERAGFSYEYFLSLFNSSDPDTFLDSINRLNTALQEQETRATALTKGLEEVARVQGVLSRQQIAQIRNTDPNGPGAAEIVAFAQQQRAQAERGIVQAIDAIDAATAGGTQNMAEFQSSIGGVTASLVVLFDTAVRNGESAIEVLKRLADPIKKLQDLMAKAGQTPGAGFGQLSVLTEIATGAQTGPLVQLAQGLGQALASFYNSGLLSPELFAQLANGIGEAYRQLELLGKGGLEAARLMQPSLQAIWQMTQDNPALYDTLDDTTKKLLEFAKLNGLVGEKFRPAIDRMIAALDDLIAKLDEFIARMGQIPGMPQVPTPPPPGAPTPPPPGPTPTPSTPPSDDGRPLAAGGIVTRATRAIIGEAGPEAVIPLSRLGRMGAPIQITVISQIDGYEAARAITRYQPDVYRTYGAA